MFDAADTGSFVPGEVRKSDYNPAPTVVFRIPTAMESVNHSAMAAAMRDELGFNEDQTMAFFMDERTLAFFARQARRYVLRVENVAKNGEPIVWSSLSEADQIQILSSLGTSAQARLWALTGLTGAIFSGFSAEEKKTSESTSG